MRDDAGIRFLLVGMLLLTSGATMLRVGGYEQDQDTPPIRSIAFVADEDANEGRPVPVDVVAVFTRQAFERVSTVRAADWFGSVVPDALGQDAVSVRQFVVAPGECATIGAPFEGRRPLAVFVIANFRRPGVHRGQVTMADLAVELRASGFNLTERRERHEVACGVGETP